MAKKADELDFVFDDENNLVFDLEENEEIDLGEEEEAEEEEEVEEKETPAQPAGDITGRLAQVEQALANLPNTIAASIAAAMGAGKAKEQPEEEEEEELDLVANPKGFLKLIEKRVAKVIDARVDSKLKAHEPSLKQAGLNAEFQRAAAKFGDDFVSKMPLIAKVLIRSQDENGNPTITVTRAYETVKEILSTMKGNPPTKEKPKISKSELVSKTKATQSDADDEDAVGNSPRQKVRDFKGKSDNEVFDAAFNSGVNRALKGRKLG